MKNRTFQSKTTLHGDLKHMRLNKIWRYPICLTVITAATLLTVPALSDTSWRIKFGAYFCELTTFKDGTKLEQCFKPNGDQYDCIGYKTVISENTLKTEGFEYIKRKISRTTDGDKVTSIVYQMFEDEEAKQPLDSISIVSALVGKPNYIAILTLPYPDLYAYQSGWPFPLERPVVYQCQFIN
jgi:hypothetical protein